LNAVQVNIMMPLRHISIAVGPFLLFEEALAGLPLVLSGGGHLCHIRQYDDL
jgi:hypothetical protein